MIVSYFEWVQDLQSFFWTETEVVDKLYRTMETAFTQVLNASRKQKVSMRMAALSVGIKRAGNYATGVSFRDYSRPRSVRSSSSRPR